jgi:integrase
MKIILDTRRQRADGTYPICIYLFHKNTILIPTKYSVRDNQFVDGYVLNHPYKREINENLTALLDDLSYKYQRIMRNKDASNLSNKDIKAILLGKISFGSFSTYYDKFLLRKEGKTQQAYEYTRNMLCKFCDYGNLDFTSIDLKFLDNLTDYLTQQGNKVNTISIHLRNIRAVFNEALRYDMVDYSAYPFKKYKIKSQATQHRVLTTDELSRLYNHNDCAPQTRYAIDVFFLSLFLIGINPKDLFAIPLTAIKGGRIQYMRSKTDIPFNVKLHPAALDIINRVKGTRLLVRKAEVNVDTDNLRRRINDHLQTIKGFEKLTMYYARHTWATIASSLDVSDDVIAFALGHGGISAVTDRYILRSQKKADEANAKVINYILSAAQFDAL